MTRSLHPRCAGSALYGSHSAKVPSAYTVIGPDGSVRYFCDSDCLRRILEADARVSRMGGGGSKGRRGA